MSSAEVDRLEVAVAMNARSANAQLDGLVNKLNVLNGALKGVNTSGLAGMANGIRTLSSAMSSMKNVGTADFTRLAKNISNLSNMNTAGLNKAASSLNMIGKSLGNVGQISTSAQQIGELSKSISKFGNKSVETAITNMPKLATALKKMMQTLSKSPTVSKNLIDMTNALANLSSNGSKVGSTVTSMNNFFNNLTSSSHKSGNALKFFRDHMVKTNTSAKSLASTIGLLYAKYWALARIVKKAFSAVNSAMDFTETVNYYDVTLKKIGDEFSNEFSKYGYDSATSYAESFNNRLQTLTGKMTGYTFDTDGNATSTNTKSLGLDVNQMTEYQANVLAITNSLGLAGETSYNTAKAFSMLAADMSSLKNVELSTVMTNLTSGLVGQSRALYKYGIDITNNTLAQYALSYGIKKSVSEMSQSEKMQLRLLAVLDQSKVAWGDMANTLESPSNQLRILKQNFTQLSRAIGNLFLPMVTKVLPYVNALVISLQRLAIYMAKIFKIDLSSYNTGSAAADDSMGDLVDDAEDATSAVKELKNELMGFDEINKLSDGKDTYSTTPIDLSSQIAAAMADYDKAWAKAYENMSNKAQELADSLTEAFKNHDYEGMGSTIGNAITSQLNSIPWNSIYSVTGQFGTGLAQFLNGLISPNLFSSVGSTIAGAINTAIAGTKNFGEEFKFDNLGSSLASGLNTFMSKINWKDALKSSSTLGKGIATALNSFIKDTDFDLIGKTVADFIKMKVNGWYSFITTFDFSQLGDKIGDSINGFFKEMNNIDDSTGLTGWQKLGKMIGRTIGGIADSIVTALGTVDWAEVGKAVKDFIAAALSEMNINVAKVGIIIGGFALVNTALKVAMGGLRAAIAAKIAAAFGTVLGGTASTAGAGGALSIAIPSALATIGTLTIGAGIVVAGANIGKNIGNALAGTDYSWGDIFKELPSALAYPFTDIIPDAIKKNMGNTTSNTDMWLSGFGTSTSDIKKSLKKKFKNIKKAWNTVIAKDQLASMKTDVKDDSQSWWSKTASYWKNKVDAERADSFRTDVKDDSTSWWDNTKQWWSGNVGSVDNFVTNVKNESSAWWSNVKTWWADRVGNVKEFGTNVKNKAGTWWDNTKVWWSEKVDSVDEFVTNVKDDASTWWSNTKQWWANVPDKIAEFEANVKEDASAWWTKAKTAWGNVKDKIVDFSAQVKDEASNWWDGVKTSWGNIKDKTLDVGTKIVTTGQNLWDNLSSAWNEVKTNAIDVKASISEAVNGIKDKTLSFTANIGDFDDKIKGEKTVSGFISHFTNWSKSWDDSAAKKISGFSAYFTGWAKSWDNDSGMNVSGFKAYFTDWAKSWGDSAIKKVHGFKAYFTDWGKSWGDSDKKSVKGFKSYFSGWTKSWKDTATNKIKGFQASINSTSDGRSVYKKKNDYVGVMGKITGWLSAVTGKFHITKAAQGGVFTPSGVKPITKYAAGGTPNMGQMFVAREAGPELVGNLGGHTAVMNNDQIVSSVANGVYNAVKSAMGSTVSSAGQPIQLNVYVGGQKLTDYVIKDVNNRTIATGRSPILGLT